MENDYLLGERGENVNQMESGTTFRIKTCPKLHEENTLNLTKRRRRASSPAKFEKKTLTKVLLWRKEIWNILHYIGKKNHHPIRFAYIELWAEKFILSLILVNVLLTLIMPLSSLIQYIESTEYFVFLCFSAGVFLFEYLLRLWSCVEDKRYRYPILGRLRWMSKPISIIDFICLFPKNSLALRGASILRVVRVLSMLSFLRIERSYEAAKKIKLMLLKKKDEFLIVGYMTALIVLISSITIFCLENPVQPENFSNVAVGALWTIVTMTSLGFANLVPLTTLGKILTAFLALLGVALFAIPGALIGSAFVQVMLEQKQNQQVRLHRRILNQLSSNKSKKSSSNISSSTSSTYSKNFSITSISSPPASSSTADIDYVHMDNTYRVHKIYDILQTIQKRQEVIDSQIMLQKDEMKSIFGILRYYNQEEPESSRQSF